MRKTILALLFVLALTGCGYRAPMHPSYLPVVTDSTLYAGIRPGYQQLAALMEKDTGMKPIEGNTVSLVFEGQENLDRMLDDVRAAEVSIYIEPYRFCLDSVGTILAGILREKAAAGLDVRLILDKSANSDEDIRKLKKLRDDGAMVNTFHRPAFFLDRWIPKLATHRNHRKLLLLDGTTAYVGSRNIQDKYFFDWHDADVRITGPVLADLTGTSGTSGSTSRSRCTWRRTFRRRPCGTRCPGWNSSSTFLFKSFRNTRRTSGCPPETASNGP